MKKIKTLADCEQALNRLQIIRSTSQVILANANKKSAEMRQGIVEELGALREEEIRLNSQIESYTNSIRTDAEIFTDEKKSVNLHSGTIGFRSTKETVAVADGFDEEDVIKLLSVGKLKKCVKSKTTKSIDKTQIMNMVKKGEISDEDLKNLGLKKSQEENFYIDLKTVDA